MGPEDHIGSVVNDFGARVREGGETELHEGFVQPPPFIRPFKDLVR